MIYNLLADLTMFRAIDALLYMYIKGVALVAGPHALAIILSTGFAFLYLSLVISIDWVRLLYLGWVWRQHAKKDFEP